MTSPANFYLLRGLGRDSRHWGSFIQQLESQSYCHKAIGMDLPGTGRFNELSSPLTIKQTAEFVATQIETDEHEPKVLVAVSLGAMVGLELLKIRPQMFQKAFVMNSSFKNLSPIKHRLQLAGMKQLVKILSFKNDPEKSEYEVLKMVSANKERWQEVSQEWAKLATEKRIKPQNFARQLAAAALYKLYPEPPETPVIILNGGKDKMVHPDCSQALADYWEAPLYTNLKAGHDICIDDPEWVLERIEHCL